jgi:hypothetical protein
MLVIGIDKVTKERKLPFGYVNVDVYKNERITDKISFYDATASQQEISRFCLTLDMY